MARFFPLTITDIVRETRDAVAITLQPSTNDKNSFDFIQGQYLTFRKDFDGEEIRRSYSICAGKDEGILRVGIKRVDGGLFSNWANDDLKIGDTLDAMPPMGKFYTPIEPDAHKQYIAFVAGSGITPVLSIIKTVLAREPLAQFTLIYANKQANSIMFREELEDLKNIYLDRFSLVHVLKGEGQDIDLFAGRIDHDKLEKLCESWVDLTSTDVAYICGPEQMMLTVADFLRNHGMSDGQIKFELFASAPRTQKNHQVKTTLNPNASNSTATVTVTLDGSTHHFDMPKQGINLLDAALENQMDAPYACKAGVCSTCRAKVLEGDVEMVTNHALEDYEVEQGYVLTCQCYPLSDKVVVSYDQ
ncbi:1,2-phenylacetyl-CoA epoxidase subunit PaaE [Bartonella sp. LJL80]